MRVVQEHRHLFTDLGQALLTSVVAPIDIAVIAARIIQPEFLDRFPDYVTEASAQLNDIELQNTPPRERIKWLSVPLCAPARTGHLEDASFPVPRTAPTSKPPPRRPNARFPASSHRNRSLPSRWQWLWQHAHVRGVAPQPFPHATASALIRRARGFRNDGQLDEALATDGCRVGR